MSWMDKLKPCPDFRQPAWARGPESAEHASVDANAGLDADRKLVRRAAKRRMMSLLHVSNAARHLDRLPDAGETFHCVVRGNYSNWDTVAAVLAMAAPARIDALHIATLSFSHANAGELLDMLDDGRVGKVWLLASCYFCATNPEIYDPLANALAARGHRIRGARTHAKVMLFALSDGRRLSMEASANMRSCRNVEQFTFTNDPDLHDFHRQWIEEMTDERAAPDADRAEDRARQHPNQRRRA